MAAPGSTPIVLYHSTTATAVPSNANLTTGELALNAADMKLYTENDSGVVTLLASGDSAAGVFGNLDLSGNTISSTNGNGDIIFDPDGTGSISMAGPVAVADNIVTAATLQDYAVKGQAKGNTGAAITLDLNDANFFTATVDQATTFTFSDPPASGDFGAFVLELTDGGAFLVTWPVSVDWPGGTGPNLTASGVDQLVFTTRDAGTTWFGFVAGLDIK